MEKGFLSINEVSEYLGIKLSTLYSWAKGGEIPHYKLGKLLRFKKGDIDNWMETHKEGINVVDKKARGILKAISRPGTDIASLVKKTIAEVKGNLYTPSHGKPDQSRSLRKEVSDGTL